jgi:hypothetical protein
MAAVRHMKNSSIDIPSQSISPCHRRNRIGSFLHLTAQKRGPKTPLSPNNEGKFVVSLSTLETYFGDRRSHPVARMVKAICRFKFDQLLVPDDFQPHAEWL